MTGFDPHRCPDCSATLDGGEACPSCGLPLRGPLAIELWRVSNEIARLTTVRASLLGRLRAERAVTDEPGDTEAPAPALTPWPVARPAKPRREWTPQRVQNVILLTGVLVTLVAAVIFTAFQWGGLPVWARGGLMLGATAATAYGARYVHRRGLTSSAEAIAALAVALGAIDAYAFQNVAFRTMDDATYWTFATAVLAGGAAAFARVVPARSVRHLSLALVQLPVLITAVHYDDWTAASRGLLFGVQAAALLAASRLLGGLAPAARWAGAANWVVAFVLAWSTAWGTGDRAELPAAAAILALLAAVPMLWPGARTITTGLSTATLVLAALALPRLDLTATQYPAAIAAVGLLAVVAAAALPRGWREGPIVVGGATAGVALLAVGEHVLTALAVPFAWAADAWSVGGDPAARAVLGPDLPWEGSVVVLGVVAAAAAAAAVIGVVVERRAVPYALALGTAAVALVPLGFAWTFRGALAWDVIAGSAALAAAAATRRTWVALPGCALLALATGWSLANDAATLCVLAVVAVAFGAVATVVAREEASAVSAAALAAIALSVSLSRGTPLDRAAFGLATTACGLLAAAAILRLRYAVAVALVAYATAVCLAVTGAGWLAWTLALGAAVTGGVAVRDRRLAPASAGLAIACAGVTAAAFGWPAARTGIVVALAASAAVGVAALLRDDKVEMAGGAGYVVAAVLASGDVGWLSWVLLAGGLTALADAIRPERRDLAWVGGLLLTGWSWARLGLEDVRTPEAYTVPPALLALLFGHLRRRRNPKVGSWDAYRAGLTLLLGPSLWLVTNDPGLARPVLLGAVSMAVLFAGINERLQAPITMGAAVLVADAVVQIAPFASALPKWASIGTAGLVVIAVGVTYEDRRRDVERLRETYDSMA